MLCCRGGRVGIGQASAGAFHMHKGFESRSNPLIPTKAKSRNTVLGLTSCTAEANSEQRSAGVFEAQNYEVVAIKYSKTSS